MANTTGKKFGGREKGTPNKLTKELRSALKDVLYDEIEQIPHRLNALEAKDGPMNNIKTIIELRAHHERFKEVVTTLKRLEERSKNQWVKADSPTPQRATHSRHDHAQCHQWFPYISGSGRELAI